MAPPTTKDEEHGQNKKLLLNSGGGGRAVYVGDSDLVVEPIHSCTVENEPRYSSWGFLSAVSRIGRRVRPRRYSKNSSAIRCDVPDHHHHHKHRSGGEGGGSGVKGEETLICLIEESPFHMLKEAARGSLDGFRKAHTADPSRLKVKDDKGQTPLHVAVSKGHVDIVEFILEQEIDVDVADNDGETALHTAARHNQPHIMELLLRVGGDHSLLNQLNMAPLHLACDMGFVEVVKVLARDPKVDKNQRGDIGARPLHYCSYRDYAECAVILLENGAKPCKKCDLGNFPIHIAAKSAAARTMEVLIQQALKLGYNLDDVLSFRDKSNNMPLHSAVIGGNIKAVEVCLRAGAPVNTQQDDKSTPIHFAAAQGNLSMTQLMSESQEENFKAALFLTDAMSMTPLHRAALFNHKAMVQYLLMKGADINSVDNKGCTPLLLAAGKGCWETVQFLVDSGADVRVRNHMSRNFLHLAIRFGGKLEQFFLKQEGTMDIRTPVKSTTSMTTPPKSQSPQESSSGLVQAEQTSALSCRCRVEDMHLLLDEKDEFGCTPLHYASKAGHLLAIEELIKLGATPSLKNNAKQSPFHFACRYGRYNTCRRLLDLSQGPNIMNETDSDGLTGLHIAAQNGHTKIISLLMERGAVIHRDNDDNSPLHHAAVQGWTQSMKILLAIHSNLLDIKNIRGETALHVAAQQGQWRAMSLLLTMGAGLERDKADKIFFDYVIEQKLSDVAMAVVKHDRWEEVLRTPSAPYDFPFLGLIEHMPAICEAVLDRCQVTSNHEKNHAEYYIEYNFRFLTCPSECIETARKQGEFNPLCTLNAMVKHGRVNCLSHPVCVKCLRLKWCSYGMWFYTLVLGLYMLFVTSLTVFVCNNDSLRHCDDGDVDNQTVILLSGNEKRLDDIPALSKLCMWVVAVFSVLSMVKEVLQMITQGVRYFLDYQNAVEWSLYVSAMLFSTPFLLNFSFHWQWEAGACAVFLAWFNLLVMLQRFDFFGLYVVMFLEILRTLLQALCVFSVLIVAFGLAFYILLNKEATHAYSTPGLSILRSAMMMLELDYLASFNGPYTDTDHTSLHFGGLTLAMVVLFVLLMPILLMNLLIGLAVGDIEAVQRNARLKRLAGQVEMYTDMERKMPMFLLARLSHTMYRQYPNKCKAPLLSFWSRVSAADKDDFPLDLENQQHTETMTEITKQKQKLKEMGSVLERNNQLLRLIMQKMEIHTEDDAWDEGQRMDSANKPGIIFTSDSPLTAARHHQRGGSALNRSIMFKSSIVNFMKKSSNDK